MTGNRSESQITSRHINAYRIRKCTSLSQMYSEVRKSSALSLPPYPDFYFSSQRQPAVPADLAPLATDWAELVNYCVHSVYELFLSQNVALKFPQQQNCKEPIQHRRKLYVFMSLVLTVPAGTIMKFLLPRVEWTVMIMMKQNCWLFFPPSPLSDGVSSEL